MQARLFSRYISIDQQMPETMTEVTAIFMLRSTCITASLLVLLLFWNINLPSWSFLSSSQSWPIKGWRNMQLSSFFNSLNLVLRLINKSCFHFNTHVFIFTSAVTPCLCVLTLHLQCTCIPLLKILMVHHFSKKKIEFLLLMESM